MREYLNTFVCKDALSMLAELPDQSVQCIVTSPPYFNLRNYGVDGQIGMEDTPDAYVDRLVVVFREARRVLRDDGTLWLNLGDSYNGSGKGEGGKNSIQQNNKGSIFKVKSTLVDGLKPKDLLGIPFRVVFALQADGWYWRSTMPWIKANAFPESVKDRPTSGVEYVFLLAKSNKYYYDYEAVLRPYAKSSIQRVTQLSFDWQTGGEKDYGPDSSRSMRNTLENFKESSKNGRGRRYRNTDMFYDSLDELIETTGAYLDHLRHVRENRGAVVDGEILAFDIPIRATPYAHFATFPPTLIEPMILAGSPVGGVVMDFFCGSGTVGVAAKRLGRQFICSDLNPEYIEIAHKRMEHDE